MDELSSVSATTASFTSYSAYRESGVAWLGKIPSHWEVWRSKRLFALRNERARVDDEQLTASQKHGVIPQNLFMEIEDQKVVQVILNPEILKHVEPGDFVISMRSFQGGIEHSNYRGCISSAYVMLIPSQHVYGPFYRYLLKSATYIQALQSTSNLVRDGQALRYQNFAQVDLPFIPRDEQVAIATFLDIATSDVMTYANLTAFFGRFSELSEHHRIKEFIELGERGFCKIKERFNRASFLLEERRMALISAAVTGKIDVRGWKRPPTDCLSEYETEVA